MAEKADDSGRTDAVDESVETEAGDESVETGTEAGEQSVEMETETETETRDESGERGTGRSVAQIGDDPLVVWALASFHTATLTAVLVATLYRVGSLGGLLAGLQTVVGLGLYLALWASTWWTTRRVLRVVGDPDTDASASVVVGTGGKWAGVNGVLFFWVLLVVAVMPVADVSLEGVLYFLAFGGIGTLLALGFGAIVGVPFAVLDLALFWVAVRLVPESGR